METALYIILTFSAVYGSYMLICAIISVVCTKELRRRGIDTDGDRITIAADAASLEYLAGCALMSSTFERKKIILLIDRSDPDALSTAEMLCRSHKNIFIG